MTMVGRDDMKEWHQMTAGTLRRWACPVVSVILTALVLIALDWSPWKVLMLAILLTCPIVAIWGVIQGNKPLPIPVGDIPQTRGSTLDWLAPYYDWVCRTAGIGQSFRRKTIAHAQLRRGEEVLDIGCGTGVLTRLAAGAVGPDGDVLGVDPASDMIRLARIGGHEDRSTARFEPAAIENLPAAAESVDVALLSFVIHCLPSDLKRTGLREVWRVLKPGGRVIVVDLDQPTNAAVRVLLSPFLVSEFFGDHLKGLIPELLRGVGFERVTELDRWRSVVRTWVAYKPMKASQ